MGGMGGMPAGMDFSKILGDPEIMAAMQNPKTKQVFMDMQQVVCVQVCGVVCGWVIVRFIIVSCKGACTYVLVLYQCCL